MSDTFATVKQLLAGEFHIDPDVISPQTELAALGVDSLAALEFVFVLEDAFHVTMDATTDLRGGLVQNVVDAVDLALSRQPSIVASVPA
jgi:acyl carrier protein